MPNRKGRKWAWDAWDVEVRKTWAGNYATASAWAALCFFALLSLAIILKAVSPTPVEMDEYPMLVAKRVAAKHIFEEVYMAECNLAALNSIKEPLQTFARKTGFYSAEAFPSALRCLDENLVANGLSSVDVQLRSVRNMEALLDLSCVGDLRQTDVCSRAFIYAQKRGEQVGSLVASKLLSGSK